jgi:ubiquinone/menaquinone biosynthesis C-methylase UbiE
MAIRRPRPSPDREAALAMYRQRAGVYDLELALFEPIRRQAVALLGLKRGSVVLDVACGTGLSFSLLEQAIGPRGRIVGIEQSPEMIASARERCQEHHWKNVTLIDAPAETAALAVRADAALFHFTHDVLQQPAAVANIVRHLRPGARVVACGLKWAGPWTWPANLFVLPAALHSVTTLTGLRRPWQPLEPWLEDLDVRSMMLGAVYLASGRLASDRR